MRAASMLAPLERHAAHDHQIAVDDRRNGAAAVRGEQTKVLTERSFPQHFSVAVQSDQVSAAAKHVNISGRRIANRRRPTDAVWRHVAQVSIEAMLPQQLAGIGVEGHNPFLQRLALSGCILQVNAIAHHDGRRASTIRRFPGEILAGRRPFFRQIFFQ